MLPFVGSFRPWASAYCPPPPRRGALAHLFRPPLAAARPYKAAVDSCGLHASHYLHIPLYSISLMIIFVEVLEAVTRSLGPFMHKRAWICSQCHGAALVLGRCLVTVAADRAGADCLATCRFSKKKKKIDWVSLQRIHVLDRTACCGTLRLRRQVMENQTQHHQTTFMEAPLVTPLRSASGSCLKVEGGLASTRCR